LKIPNFKFNAIEISPFSDETVASVLELGEHLRSIHNRLISEGYVIKNGKIYPPEQQEGKTDSQ
jgi:hypothetical protein